MINSTSVKHKIRKHIIDLLTQQKYATFTELRPKNTDTNLVSYHLTNLVKTRMVEKTERGYTLGPLGISYVETGVSEAAAHPKVIVMLVIQNSDGDILLYRRRLQPFIDTWTLPYDEIGVNDRQVSGVTSRIATQKLGVTDASVVHAGDCYIRVIAEDDCISTTLAHIYTFNSDAIGETDDIRWARPHKLHQYQLAPAVEEIIARTFFRDPFFFEEFTTEWQVSSVVDEPIHQ